MPDSTLLVTSFHWIMVYQISHKNCLCSLQTIAIKFLLDLSKALVLLYLLLGRTLAQSGKYPEEFYGIMGHQLVAIFSQIPYEYDTKLAHPKFKFDTKILIEGN